MTQQQWRTLTEAVHAAYRKAARKNANIDRAKLQIVLTAFYGLYCARSSTNEENFYVSNLIQAHRVEGAPTETIGTVAEAVQRTEKFFAEQAELWGHQGEIISRNLVNVLAKEQFPSTLRLNTILMPHQAVLEQISIGTP
ncbi:MAG: hypothetical protein JWR07_4089 [Nevskia sp.]|nr:hypothetical protein [Nevskia sp.]